MLVDVIVVSLRLIAVVDKVVECLARALLLLEFVATLFKLVDASLVLSEPASTILSGLLFNHAMISH